MNNQELLVKMSNIYKDFPGVRALNDVDFDLKKGEIHVLVGENGAGKSTLVKILAGVHQMDQGNILINGKDVSIHNTSSAQKLGVAIVFQECNLVQSLTVAQNIFINHEPKHAGFIVDVDAEERKSHDLLKELSIDIDPAALVSTLSLGKQQLVSFVRALSFNPRVIILDEPTSSLSEKDADLMFSTLRKLRNQGLGIIYISHRLEELLKIGDRITILRDGKKIDTVDAKKVKQKEIIQKMVGRDITEMYPKEKTSKGEEIFRIEGLTQTGVCENINLFIRSGEVVGLFGLIGAGRTEIMRMVFGLDPMQNGSVFIRGKRISHISPGNMVKMGIGFSPEDRKNEGLCLPLSLKENIERASLDKLFPNKFINRKTENEIAHKYIRELDIASPSIERLVMYLSGGTQQKVVIAQWLCAESSILILDEPTRGIDVGTKVEIYKIINSLAKNGSAILIISSELPEIMGICDRIYVLCKGKISGEYSHQNAKADLIATNAFETQEVMNATACK